MNMLKISASVRDTKIIPIRLRKDGAPISIEDYMFSLVVKECVDDDIGDAKIVKVKLPPHEEYDETAIILSEDDTNLPPGTYHLDLGIWTGIGVKRTICGKFVLGKCAGHDLDIGEWIPE